MFCMRQIEKRIEGMLESVTLIFIPGAYWRPLVKKLIEKRKRLKALAKEQNDLLRFELLCEELKK